MMLDALRKIRERSASRLVTGVSLAELETGEWAVIVWRGKRQARTLFPDEETARLALCEYVMRLGQMAHV